MKTPIILGKVQGKKLRSLSFENNVTKNEYWYCYYGHNELALALRTWSDIKAFER